MSTFYFVGSGIASLAGAAYLIRDASIRGRDSVIFEESIARRAPRFCERYYMSGSRMFEDKYNCTFDLMSSVPAASNSSASITDKIRLAEAEIPWSDTARLIDRSHTIIDSHALGFAERDRIALLALMAEALQFAVEGKVKGDIELQPLSAINAVLTRLERGDVAARVVLDFVGVEKEAAAKFALATA